jgi:hypothetical protein
MVAGSQITMRKVDGCQTFADTPIAQCIDVAAYAIKSSRWRCRYSNFHQLRDTTKLGTYALSISPSDSRIG